MKLQRKVYTTRSEKIIDLVIGLAVFLLLNALLAGLGWAAMFLPSQVVDAANPTVISIVAMVVNILPFIINGALVVLFAFWRPWIALGMLAGFAVLMILGLCLAVAAGAACLVILSQMGP